MTKHWALSFGVLGLILGLTLAAAANVKQNGQHEEIHYHAGFQVYVNDELQEFSDLKYMKLTPCGEHKDDLTSEAEQLEKAHLHDFNGDVAHVHREGATWSDLFQNMEYELDQGSLIAYVNGERIEDSILARQIQPNDSVVIFVGTNRDIDTKLAGAVTLDRIREVGALSEDCGAD